MKPLTTHSVRMEKRPHTDGKWIAICTCGETCPTPSAHKPIVDAWRKAHYREAQAS